MLSEIMREVTKAVLEERLAKLKIQRAEYESDAALSANGEIRIGSNLMAIHAKSGVELYTWALKGMDAASTITALQERVMVLEEALTKIASFGDYNASEHLRRTGSYSSFDEPCSVHLARTALGEKQ